MTLRDVILESVKGQNPQHYDSVRSFLDNFSKLMDEVDTPPEKEIPPEMMDGEF